jgi:hypothetical protein
MGYRSDVYLAVKKEEVEKVDHAHTLIGKLLSQAGTIDVRDDKIYYEFHNVKWYDGYEDIAALMDWLAELDETCEDFLAPYQFVRIGEEYEDIELLGSWEFGEMYINRSVSY